MIATIAGSEVVDVERERFRVIVETREHVSGIGIVRERSFEFGCWKCGALSTDLTEQEAVDEMVEHVCPDVPPCEAVE